MPLLRAAVRNEYALGAPELYREANKEDPKEILEGVTVAGLVGVLRQLGDLAEFAGEVFHGLQEEVAKTSSRSRKLMDRAQQIEAALSPLEKVVLTQKSHLHFAYTAGVNWHTRIRCRHSHVLYSEVPQFIMDSYEDCHNLPNLDVLDKFDPGGPGSCLKRYSDPTFFKRASVASGVVSAKKKLKDKKGRRIKKRRSWASNGEVSRHASFSCNSGRMQFTQLNTGVRPSPTQTATTLRSEMDEQSNLHVGNGSGYSEGDSRPSYSVQPEEHESRESISSPVMRRNSDFLDYDFVREKIMDAYDDLNVSQEKPARLSSVTWDEKGVTLDHITREPNNDGMTQENHNAHTESFPPNLDVETIRDYALDFETVEKMGVQPQACDDLNASQEQAASLSSVNWDGKGETLDHIKWESNNDGMMQENHNSHTESCSSNLDLETIRDYAIDFEVVEKMDVQPRAVPALESTDAHLDDIESETDHFMDALNSIESEGDTDVDGGKKQELQRYSKLKDSRVRNEVCQPTGHNSECVSSSIEYNVLANDFLPSLADTSCGHCKSESPKSPCEANDSIGGVEIKDEFNSIFLDDRTLQSSQTHAISSTPGSPVQEKDKFDLGSFVGKTLQLSQPDVVSSTPGSLHPVAPAKDEFNSVSLVNETLQLSQTDVVASRSGSSLQEKVELCSASSLDKTLQPPGTDQLLLMSGSPQTVDSQKNGSVIVGDNVESVVSSTTGSTPPAKDEFNNSVSFGNETLESTQTDVVASIPGSPLQAKDELSSASFLDKTLQPSGTDQLLLMSGCPQAVDSEKNGRIIVGDNLESVSCAVLPNFNDDGSRMPISNRTMNSFESQKPASRMPISNRTTNSFESQKPASEMSSIASVTFWTNGGLLGLMPSKPPDFSTSNGILQDPVLKKDDHSENLKNIGEGHDMSGSNGHESQERGISTRKPSWKLSPAALNIDLGKLGNSLRSNASSTGSSATPSGNVLPMNSMFQAIRKQQEYNGSSSLMYGLSNGLRPSGSNKKLLLGGDENSCAAECQRAIEQKNHRNAAYCTYSERNKVLCGESLMVSPSSSPPLQHMKISFQPMDGFETSKLKLKFPEGNVNNRSVGDVFPSFQLVPEASITQHDVGFDSDADTFYRSSPSVSDDCHSIRSESNSEQWESSESPTSKDCELYDALRWTSLTESVSSGLEKGRINHEDIHNNSGYLRVGLGLQNFESSPLFDHQSLGSASHSFGKELRNRTSQKDLVPQSEPCPDPPRLSPFQWQGMALHMDGTESQHEAMPEDSYYGFHLKHSSTISQPKPAPSSGDHIDTVNSQKHKAASETNERREVREGKSIDEKGDFLYQIRMKSFNLRPTSIDKPTIPPQEASAHVQFNAILEKANAIRQAVGSDEEEDGTWGDT